MGYNIIKITGNTAKEYNIRKSKDLLLHYNLHKVPKIIQIDNNKAVICSRFSGIYLYKNDSIVNLVKHEGRFSASATYTDMVLWNDDYYVSSNFGILEYSNNFKNSSFIKCTNVAGKKINNLFADDNLLYIAKEGGFFIAKKTSIKKYPPLSSDITKLL